MPATSTAKVSVSASIAMELCSCTAADITARIWQSCILQTNSAHSSYISLVLDACHHVPVLQTNNTRTSWDAVWMAPEEIAKEGIIISPHLLDDHYTITLEVMYITLCGILQIAHQTAQPDRVRQHVHAGSTEKIYVSGMLLGVVK